MTTKQTKVIKRYANRKLYDTERSCYVTLEEIAHMIKEGDEVRVIDNKSKDDLTAVTLAQIIVEEEKKVAKMPLKLLRSIIQSGNEAIGDFYQKRLADPVDDVRQRVGSLFKKEEAETPAPVTPEGDGVVKEFVSSATEAFEHWQKRIDERVKDALSRGSKPEVDALRAKIDELEAKLTEIEARSLRR